MQIVFRLHNNNNKEDIVKSYFERQISSTDIVISLVSYLINDSSNSSWDLLNIQ